MIKLFIFNKEKGKYFYPAVESGVDIEWAISGSPGKAAFVVRDDDKLNFREGDIVIIKTDKDDGLFYGYVFTKKRTKDSRIEVTAYDQLRYLKNKDSLVYKGQKASEVVQMLADDFQLQVGELADTGFVIDKRSEDNSALMDIIQTALDLTLVHTKKLFVLYDDFGKLMLKEPKDMRVPILIDGDTAQDFAYESTIDKDTYNLIKLVVEDKEAGKRKEYYAPSKPSEFAGAESAKQWGILQYYEKLDKNIQSPQERANQMLEHYNSVMRTFSVDGAFGDARVRAGSMIYVRMDLGDISLGGKGAALPMIVTNVKHHFADGHFMDLQLKGGLINA